MRGQVIAVIGISPCPSCFSYGAELEPQARKSWNNLSVGLQPVPYNLGEMMKRVRGKVKKSTKRKYQNDIWSKFMRKVIRGMRTFCSPAFKK